ncbi:MAG TPA: hypothetical protein VGB63_13070 [Pedobacter sp.]|jgi:hypothetical protein
MRFEEFTSRVRQYTSLQDFTENQHLLEGVDNAYYDAYLHCLVSGSSIKPAFKALDTLIRISGQVALSPEHVLDLLPDFRELIGIFDARLK